MNVATGVSLRIDLKIGDRCDLTFESYGEPGERLPVQSHLGRLQLSNERKRIRKDLDQIKQIVGGVSQVPTWSVASQAMLDLHRLGRSLLLDLCDKDGEKIRQVETFCRQACPKWDKVGFDSNALLPHMVEVHAAAEDGIPVELLPLFNFKKPDPIQDNDYRRLREVAQSFLGFSTIVKRGLRGTPPTSRQYLENFPRLSLKLFQYYGLVGARNEAEFFVHNKKHFDLDSDGPWPNKGGLQKESDFVETLANHLWDPTVGFAGEERRPPDQVLHFACHCDTSAENSDDYELRLGAPSSFWDFRGLRPYSVSLRELQDYLGQLSYRGLIKNKSRPLVFFNACESSNLDPAGLGSFLELFLNENYDYLGFIGTEAAIPDSFADVFAKQLYRRLLEGYPLGKAIHKVRWEMLAKFLNPLGILYNLYADPEIRIRQPVDGPIVD